MPEKDDGGCEVDEALEIVSVILIAHNESAEVKKPGEHSFDFPISDIIQN